jgi:predicted dehydrogenase
MVLAVLSSGGPAAPSGPHDTEDSAVVVMRFAGGAIGSVTATWSAGPPEDRLTLHSTDQSRVFAPRRSEMPGTESTTEQDVIGGPASVWPASAWAAEVNRFLGSLRAETTDDVSVTEALGVVSVLESAYLSAKTGQPESPGRFYELHDLPAPARPQPGTKVRPGGRRG